MIEEHKVLFIGGLHRSGTSILHRCLRNHSEISGFSDTGFPQDEGMFLQTVFQPAKKYGGPGKFGFHPKSHLTEESSILTTANKQKLIADWSHHWDLDKPILVEKSPPNLLRTRFLQAIFPRAYFVIVMRHPLVTSLATQKWSNTSLYSLLDHWFVCYDLFRNDRSYLDHFIEIKYEDLVAHPSLTLSKIYSFIECENQKYNEKIIDNFNNRYYEIWTSKISSPLFKIYSWLLIKKYKHRIEEFGYQYNDF